MNQRVIADPSQHGWVEVDGKWVWDAESGGAGAGMVISETEPTDKVEGMQWLNPTTGLVLFWDDEKWLQMPTTGAAGKDGADAVWSENANGANYTGTVTVNGELLAAQSGAGDRALAIGSSAGSTGQGAYTVAAGIYAGNSDQGESAVAVGRDSGRTDQGINATAVGFGAGNATQGESATALGRAAGMTNQGDYSIAIGEKAGETNQGNNGIIINSSGATVNDTNVGHIIIKSSTQEMRSLPNGGFAMNRDPIVGARSLINTLSTLRNATMDETTLEGMRDALAGAISGLIEGLEHEIATMPAPEPQVGTQEISE
jgi:hypothetical protein